jgi:hypothetical protein
LTGGSFGIALILVFVLLGFAAAWAVFAVLADLADAGLTVVSEGVFDCVWFFAGLFIGEVY